MKLEKQVCSLKLAKRLKELGVRQESLFYWVRYQYKDWLLEYQTPIHHGEELLSSFSAFTCSELGEMLPAQLPFTKNSVFLEIDKDDGGNWELSYSEPMERCFVNPIKAKTEANVRAKMLCHLLENKLIDLKEKK